MASLCQCKAMHDIQTPVAFLTARVKWPDEDNWGKLKRVLKYMNWTQQLKLTIQSWKLDLVKWFVEASYAIHDDCKGHTEAMMTLKRDSDKFLQKTKLECKKLNWGRAHWNWWHLASNLMYKIFFWSTGISNKRKHNSSRQWKHYYSKKEWKTIQF